MNTERQHKQYNLHITARQWVKNLKRLPHFSFKAKKYQNILSATAYEVRIVVEPAKPKAGVGNRPRVVQAGALRWDRRHALVYLKNGELIHKSAEECKCKPSDEVTWIQLPWSSVTRRQGAET